MFSTLLSRLIQFRLMVFILLSVFIGGVIFTIPRLNLDAFPDVTNVQVTVNTQANGLAAEEVEQLITYPLESSMYALTGVTEVRSLSRTGLSVVTVVFADGTDIYFARQQVFEKLSEAREMIPEQLGIPKMGPNTSGLGEVFQYTLRSDNPAYDAAALRTLNDFLVKLLLMPVDGVTEILSFGGPVLQYQVQIDPVRLLEYDLTMEQVFSTVADNNLNAGGWFMPQGDNQLVVRGAGMLPAGDAGLEAIRQLPIIQRQGIPVRIGDVASVGFGHEIRVGAVTMTKKNESGETEALGEVVAGIILQRTGANTKAVIDGIEARLDSINSALPEGVYLEAYYDQSHLIERAVTTIRDAVFFAFVLIVLVLLGFLRNIRASVLVLLSIPLSIGVALLFMHQWGISANLMSLGGLAIATGLMIDASVVMVERIFQRLTASQSTRPMTVTEHIIEAGQEVARPVMFATLIIMTVFVPLFFLEGVESKLFQPMAVSVILGLAGSLIVALVIVPPLASYLFKKAPKHVEPKIYHIVERGFIRGLTLSLKKPLWVGVVTLAFVSIAVLLGPRLETEFAPELEEGTINMRVTLAPSANLDTSIRVAQQLEGMLMDFPEVTYALSRIGSPELGGDPEPINNIEMYIGLTDMAAWQTAATREELQSKMNEVLGELPGVVLNFSQPIATRVDELLSGVRAQLAIKLFGSDLGVLVEKGEELQRLVDAIPGTTDVALEQISGEEQLTIRPDYTAMSRYGFDVADLMAWVRLGVGGENAGQILDGNARHDINVRLHSDFRASPESIARIPLKTASGAIVLLGDITEITRESAAPMIRRENAQRRIVIESNISGRAMGSVVADIQSAIQQFDLPAGYTIEIGGQFENQQRAQQRLMVVVPVSLLIITLFLYLAFRSIKQVALVVTNVPVALVGGVIALYLSGTYLSVPSAIGFITVFGVAMLNGVVLLDAINGLRQRGMSVQDAVLQGTASRLQPVLITAITSILALVPILLSQGIGSEIHKPLATVVLGGLITSTVLTLFVIPTLYTLIYKEKGNNKA